MMFLRSMSTGAVLAALITSPASAQQLGIEPLKPCYVAAQPDQREPINIVGQGFTPYSPVDVIIDDVHQTTAQALIDGKVTGTWPAPFVESGEREFTLRLAEQGSPTNIASVTSRVTSFTVEQSPKRARTTQKVRFKGRGFMKPNEPVYAHYVFGGRSLKTVKIGLPTGSCGTFNVRRKQFPFKKRPRVGTWTIQFDQLPYYWAQADARVPMTIKVSKAIKPKRARAR